MKVKKLLYVFLVVVLVGCAKPAGLKKIDIDINNLYDRVYDSPNTIAVATKSIETSWYGPATQPTSRPWYRPTTQPTSRPVDITALSSKLPKHGLDVVTCDDDVKKYGDYSDMTNEEYVKFKREFK